MRKRTILLVIVSVIVVFIPSQSLASGGNGIKVAMCRPLVSQIKNMEALYQLDIIDLGEMTLVCVYHESEVTDYEPSFKYVAENGLDWIEFRKITGHVPISNLFTENTWTPQFKQIFDEVKGIVFTGGMDIPPAIYGEKSHLMTEATTPVRSLYETSFLFHLLGGSQNPGFVPFLESRQEFPVLGICLGAQTMNVATGGTLYQDIPTEIYKLKTVEDVLAQDPEKIHSSTYIKQLNVLEEDLMPAFHRIRVMKRSVFMARFGWKRTDFPSVLSSHHQAIDKLGKDLEVAARSMDGQVIEAIQHKKYKRVLGVQFHPEYRALYTKGKYYRRVPGAPKDTNLRLFLMASGNSMKFHEGIWQWFAMFLRRSH